MPHSTTAVSSGAIALAKMVTRLPEKVISQHLRALESSPGATAAPAPDRRDWLILLSRQRDLLDSAPASTSARASVGRHLDAAFAHAHSDSAPAVDGTTFYALTRLTAETERQARLATAPPPDVHLDAASMPPRQRASWEALIDVATVRASGWTLVGGQMVALHCWERGAAPARPTNDGDAALDVRAQPRILHHYTAALTRLGFSSAGSNALNDHQHRWIRADGAQIDLLIPDGVGERAAARTGVTGGTTVSTPGAADALTHSRPVVAHLAGRSATVHRPHLTGAIIAKARASRVPLDPHTDRHLLDAAVLAALIRPVDRDDLDLAAIQPRHRAALGGLLGNLDARPTAWATERDRAARGLDLLHARFGR